ncbi:hypothetical protein UlMin_035491 [Ulmus minor]
MPESKHSSLFLFLLLVAQFLNPSNADVGTAAHYTQPYIPTACYGRDVSAFPASNLLGAASDDIWDNGAACGRQYLVRCVSSSGPRACIPGKTILVKIVDRAQTSVSRPSRPGATIVLSTFAFSQIANPSASSINIEFEQNKTVGTHAIIHFVNKNNIDLWMVEIIEAISKV